MIAWIASLDIKILATLIGAGSALLTILLKDVGLYYWKESRTDKKEAMDIYRSYSDPLLSATESLFWRLRETLVETGRGVYLKASGTESNFEKYKFESTLYRLAVLIGWVRAYKRELTFLSPVQGEQLNILKKAFTQLEEALANGTHIEIQRVKSVSELWKIPLPQNDKKLSILAVNVEQIIKSDGPISNSNQEFVINLSETKQMKICQTIARYLCDETEISHISKKIISETRVRAARSLSIREAWLYRDFQSGIGDLMIREISGDRRRFEVLGFKEFEALLHSEEVETKRWVSRLVAVFDKLDISGADKFDARVLMLENTFLATIDLLIALTKIDKGRLAHTGLTLSEASTLKKDQTWRKGGGEPDKFK